MELYFLDDSFHYSAGPIDDYLSLTWTDRLQEAGECSLALSPDLVKDALAAAYIYNSERGVMEVTGISYTAVGQRSLTVTGMGLLGMLDRRVILSASQPNPPETLIRSAVYNRVYAETQDARALPLPLIYTASGVTVTASAPFAKWESLYDFVTGLISQTSCGVKLELERGNDGNPSALRLTVYEGTDRTQEQDTNSRAIFSQSFGNARNIEIRKNVLDYKNRCYAYSGDTLRHTVNVTGGGPSREMAVSVDSDSQTDAIVTICRKALNEYAKVDSFTAEADQSDLVYKTDYDLGDLCDISDDTTGITTQARITAVTTVYEGGAVKVSPMFGEGTLNLRQFIKRASGATYNITNETPPEPDPEESKGGKSAIANIAAKEQ